MLAWRRDSEGPNSRPSLLQDAIEPREEHGRDQRNGLARVGAKGRLPRLLRSAWHAPTLPGCFSNGPTIEEAKRNIREALNQHLQVLESKGEAIPQAERLVHVEELCVGLP